MSEPAEQAAFDRILGFLHHARGFDFTAYRRASLMRRVLKRMEAVHAQGFDAYLDYLRANPDEFPALFNTILVNVTRFFRDPEVWDAIDATVLPTLLAGREPTAPVRVWSAGCAAGQEAYTVAILLAERLGLDAFRDRVKIYATDVDHEALTEARSASYTDEQVAEIPDPFRAKYFDRIGDRLVVKRELRRAVTVGHHDLLQDAPISPVDVLLCRNTLMYFNGDAQERIMSGFYFSIGSGGYLALGSAEMLFCHPALFEPVDQKRRIFRAARTILPRDRQLLLAAAGRLGRGREEDQG